MLTDAIYKKLVMVGASIIEDIKAIENADLDDVDKVFENGVKLYDAIQYLIDIAGDLTASDDFYAEAARIYYADTISVYAYDKEIGEKYLDLLLKEIAGDEQAAAELKELSKTIPDDEHYWVRRNL